MSTETAITPALTAEEWAADRVERTAPNGDVLVIVRDRSLTTEQAGGHHHALAALALVGKPFGFTQEDVEALRTGFGMASIPEGGVEARPMTEREQRQNSIADRIEALLPPATAGAPVA